MGFARFLRLACILFPAFHGHSDATWQPPPLRLVHDWHVQALVGNLPYSVRDDDIADFFQACGVTDIHLVKDRETGDLKVLLAPIL